MGQDTKRQARLQEIAGTFFGKLTDDEVLRILAERKNLEALETEQQASQEAAATLRAAEQEKKTLEEKVVAVNKRISSDKPDDELLQLIIERKEIEEALAAENAKLAALKPAVGAEATQAGSASLKPAEAAVTPAPVIKVPDTDLWSTTATRPVPAPENAPPQPSLRTEEFGNAAIAHEELPEQSPLRHHIEQMRSNPGSLGTVLDALPQEDKKNKTFMLEVAKIDPAYAMHYADPESLKKDEDFNLRVASMKNDRHSGNVLSEMLPEARTSQVVLAGVRQDYKNVRFVLPNMADYDEIVALAKKMTLESVKHLQASVDTDLLVPKILQKDKSFMEQVEQISKQARQ